MFAWRAFTDSWGIKKKKKKKKEEEEEEENKKEKWKAREKVKDKRIWKQYFRE